MSKRQKYLPDIELLSAYLDNQLNSHQRATLEARLRSEPGLSSELDSLRNTRQMLRSLPKLRAPRNFTLAAQTYQKRSPTRLPAFFGAVSALSSALLIILVIGGLLVGGPMKIASLDKENLAYPAAMETSPEAEIALLTEQEVNVGTEEALSLAAPSEDTSRTIEPTPETFAELPTSKLPAPTATPAMEEALTLGIQEVTTPTAYPSPLRTQADATELAEGLDAEAISGEGAKPAPWKTAMFTGEMILAGVALISGLAALILLIRQRR